MSIDRAHQLKPVGDPVLIVEIGTGFEATLGWRVGDGRGEVTASFHVHDGSLFLRTAPSRPDHRSRPDPPRPGAARSDGRLTSSPRARYRTAGTGSIRSPSPRSHEPLRPVPRENARSCKSGRPHVRLVRLAQGNTASLGLRCPAGTG